jgi:hypothetical protein
MSCPSCKGTGQVVLLYSSVPCVDCEIIPGKTFTVNLPAPPMAKCGPWEPGDRFVHHIGNKRGVITRRGPFGADSWMVRFDLGQTDDFGGEEVTAMAQYMKREDTI